MNSLLKKVLVAILFITFLTGCSLKKEEEDSGVSINASKDILKSQTVEGITFSNVSIVYQEDIDSYKVSMSAKNTTSEKIDLKEIKITLKDEEENEMVTLSGFVGYGIDSKEEKTIVMYHGTDLMNAKYIEYGIIK